MKLITYVSLLFSEPVSAPRNRLSENPFFKLTSIIIIIVMIFIEETFSQEVVFEKDLED